jgi:antitoxin component YwqK of YwqJK toxin-antitoxin module
MKDLLIETIAHNLVSQDDFGEFYCVFRPLLRVRCLVTTCKSRKILKLFDHTITQTSFDGNVKFEEGNRSKDGIPDGNFTFWVPIENATYQGKYDKGKMVGIWTKKENGVIKSTREYKKDGLSTVIKFYGNGDGKEETNYKNGIKEGLFTSWYGNGKIGKQGNYKSGRYDGVWTWYHLDGTKEMERSHVNGNSEYPYTVWENGVATSREM